MTRENKKIKVIEFPNKNSNAVREVEAILFAAEEPLDIESIETIVKKKIKANYKKMAPVFKDKTPHIVSALLSQSAESILEHIEKKEIYVGNLTHFEKWLPRKVLGMSVHWNAIWSHRLAMEIACQLSGDYGTYLNPLESYWKEYKKLYSTMPLCSNKSISHYVGQCCLDAVLNKLRWQMEDFKYISG